MSALWPGRGAAVAGLVALLGAVSIQQLWSADTWTLLSIGRWVVEHRTVPRVEEFSWTGAGREYVELRWLFCVPMYLAYVHVGEWAPSVVAAGAVALAFGLLAWNARRALREPAGFLIVGLGLVAGMTRWVMRPEVMTYVMLAAFLVGLRRIARAAHQHDDKRWGARGWWLVAAQVAWVNSHGLFVLGPILAWLVAGGEALRWVAGRRTKARAGATGTPGDTDGRACLKDVRGAMLLAILISAACFVNPYGFRGVELPWVLFKEAGGLLAKNIEELRPAWSVPQLAWRWDVWAAGALGLTTIASFAANRRSFDPVRAVVFLMGLYLGLGAQRNLGLFAVVAVWVALANLDESTTTCFASRRGRAAAMAAIGIACTAMAWWVATDRYWERLGNGRRFGVGVLRGRVAEAAADFLLNTRPKGRLYNGFGDGGYLIWRDMGPVYVYGRTEAHGPEFWEGYFAPPVPPRETWSQMADREGINTAIVPREGYEWLVEGLARLPGWALVYADARDVVFVRDIPEHAGIIARYRIDGAGFRGRG